MGIYPVFSSGNSGPNPGTAGTPGNFPIVTGVGATDSGDNIASFSSRGPAPNQDPWNDPTNWGRPDWNLTKPDISAPGAGVRSAAPGGGYQSMSGTSMACPHIAGAIALFLEKSPILDYLTLYNLLLDYADLPPQGAPYPNNDYGWGRVNCYASLNAIPVGNVPNVILRSATVVNDNNGNGRLDPGETAGIVCAIKNNGTVAATNVQSTLRTTSTTWITITDSLYTYGTMNPDDSLDNSSDPFDVVVNSATPAGTVVDFQLYIVCAETTWTRQFSKVVGVAPGTIIWGPKPTGIPTTQFIYGVAYDRIGDKLYVCDGYGRDLYTFSSDSFVTYLGAVPAPDTNMSGIESSDALWCTGWNQKLCWKIDKTSGSIIRSFLSPANDYPVGIAINGADMWLVDRRVSISATKLLYIGDTLEMFTQYNDPVQAYYNSRCLAFDELGGTYIETHTWFNSGGTSLDSVGIVEVTGEPPTLTGNRMLLNVGWNIRGIEFDPRDGNYWVTIPQNGGTYSQEIVKIKGFYEPTGVEEGVSPRAVTKLGLSAYPNPARSQLSLNVQIPNKNRISIKIYNAAGRFICTLANNKPLDYGNHNLTWNLKDANSRTIADGVYFVVLETPENRISQKLVIAR